MKNEDLRKQAWDFFQVQAAQRLSTFNYYIFICSAILAILLGRPEAIVKNRAIAVFLFFLIILLSVTFWKLDKRNVFLIKTAEETLKEFEKQAACHSHTDHPPDVTLRFLREEYETDLHNSQYGPMHWKHMYSYTDCFRIIFISFSLIGFAGMVIILASFIHDKV